MRSVIAAFNSHSEAQRAQQTLISQGVSSERIHLQGRDEVAQSGTSAAPGAFTTGDDHHGFLASVAEFFSGIFGHESPTGESGRYSEAVRRGGAVLVVDMAEEDVGRISADLIAAGAYDIDQRAAEWRAEGWQGFSMNPVTPTQEVRPTSGASDEVVQLVQEELKVGKPELDAGRVRVIRRVTDTPVQEQVRGGPGGPARSGHRGAEVDVERVAGADLDEGMASRPGGAARAPSTSHDSR